MQAQPDRPRHAGAEPAGPRQVLVVDDDAVTRDLLTTVLSLREYELAAASDGKEALAQVDEQHFDLVVLDTAMPDMDGFEVCHRLKTSRADLRVVLLTARDSLRERDRGDAVGADARVTKPFSPLELIETLQQLLEI